MKGCVLGNRFCDLKISHSDSVLLGKVFILSCFVQAQNNTYFAEKCEYLLQSRISRGSSYLFRKILVC